MRAWLVIVLAGLLATGCAELGAGKLTTKLKDLGTPAVPEAGSAPFVAQAAQMAKLEPRPSSEAGTALASKPVFEVRPSPVIAPFEAAPAIASAATPPAEMVSADPPKLEPALVEPSAKAEPIDPTTITAGLEPPTAEPSPVPALPSVPDVVIPIATASVNPAPPSAPPLPVPPSPVSPDVAFWVTRGGQSTRMPGQPVAQVGDDVITLPELTAVVKVRLSQLPPESSPSRREVISLAKSTLKGMIARSLVLQEARDVMGGPAPVATTADQIGREWDKRNNRIGSSELARDEFIVRTLAVDLMKRQGTTGDLDKYLEAVGKRRPVKSIMNESELMAAGKRAAAEERAAR